MAVAGRGASADSLRLKFIAAAEEGEGAPRVVGREDAGAAAAGPGRENDTEALRPAGLGVGGAAAAEVGGGACDVDAESPRGRLRRFSWLLLRARSAAFIRSIERLDG